jgi:hypothetical protein
MRINKKYVFIVNILIFVLLIEFSLNIFNITII